MNKQETNLIIAYACTVVGVVAALKIGVTFYNKRYGKED